MLPKTKHLHVPTQCSLYPEVQHAALLFTEATDTVKVFSAANAISTGKWPVSSAAFTYSTPGLEETTLWAAALPPRWLCCSGESQTNTVSITQRFTSLMQTLLHLLRDRWTQDIPHQVEKMNYLALCRPRSKAQEIPVLLIAVQTLFFFLQPGRTELRAATAATALSKDALQKNSRRH